MNAEQLQDQHLHPGMIAGNIGEPLLIDKIEVDGVSLNVAEQGETVSVLQRHALTSEEYFFHVCASGLANVIETAAAASGHHFINLRGAKTVIAVIKPNKSAHLWIDKAAIVSEVRLRRSVQAGSAVFQKDVLDISALRFPLVEMAEDDQVIVIIREGFRYALFFDLTREFDRPAMETTLGRLSRTLQYFERYAALANPAFFDALIALGWFPFLELQSDEFVGLYAAIIGDDDVEKCGRAFLGHFSEDRIRSIADRWMKNPFFEKRTGVLMPGVEAFVRKDPVAAIKTLLTEIEGILQDAYIAAHKKKGRTPGLIKFAADAATQKVDEGSLFFPVQFQRYLTENIYGHFDPVRGGVTASRHGVGHGAAPAETYTMVRALQTILTLDQIFHYL